MAGLEAVLDEEERLWRQGSALVGGAGRGGSTKGLEGGEEPEVPAGRGKGGRGREVGGP